MKKSLKIFLIIFVICCILVGIFLLRNYLILNKIRKLQKDTWSKIENSNNYIYEDFTINKSGNISATKIYHKDGTYKKQIYYNIENEETSEVSITKESILYMRQMAFAFVDEENFNKRIKNYMFRFIKSKDNQYIISEKVKSSLRPDGTDYFYFNKETGMLEKWETVYSTTTYKITENVVTDDDINSQ